METTSLIIIMLAAFSVISFSVLVYVTMQRNEAAKGITALLEIVRQQAQEGNISAEGFNNIFHQTTGIEEDIRVCHKCGRILPADMFTRKHAVCKECRRKDNK